MIPNTNVDIDKFWNKFSEVVHELSPINKSLIQKREIIQKKLDDWHKSNKGEDFNKREYVNFLKSIDYLIDEKNDFKIETADVDEEISSIAGPQLVVPVDNARYALNAANARWGSLYDALYGTDIISGSIGKNWDQERARKVINFVRDFLDERIPLAQTSWKNVSKFKIEENKLVIFSIKEILSQNNEQFIGYKGDKENPNSILIKNNNLHIDIIINSETMVGKIDNAAISDIVIELPYQPL